jgi:hypothetical protein
MKPVPDDLDCKQRNIGEISKPGADKKKFHYGIRKLNHKTNEST